MLTKLYIRKMELCVALIGASPVERARLEYLIAGFKARIAQVESINRSN